MSDVVVRIENLSKQYRLGTINHGTLKRDLQSWWARWLGKEDPNSKILFERSAFFSGINDYFWALKDVSFEVKQGEVVGIIGRNGAGKSTLLKILSKVTAPTNGVVKIKGRVGSLLEVGTGFHPELTGRENIYLNGAIHGMSKTEIGRKFDEIVSFAEIDKFIDTPVKRYSSGMYVRLAFAVAAHLEPEILIVDEVLAVGDTQFQKKCLGKMEYLSTREGRTVLFVSHNMVMVDALCQTAIILSKGSLIEHGQTADVIEKYICNNTTKRSVADLSQFQRSAGNQLAILEAWIENDQGDIINEVLMGSSIRICFRFKMKQSINNPGFGFGIENMLGQRISSLSNYILSKDEISTVKEGIAVCHVPETQLLPGNYLVSLSLVNQDTFIDYVERAVSLSVIGTDVYKTGKMLVQSQGVVYFRGEVFLRDA